MFCPACELPFSGIPSPIECVEFNRYRRVKPSHYGISLFDLQLGESWAYKGIVKINSKVSGPTKEVVLNSKEIEVQHAELLAADGM